MVEAEQQWKKVASPTSLVGDMVVPDTAAHLQRFSATSVQSFRVILTLTEGALQIVNLLKEKEITQDSNKSQDMMGMVHFHILTATPVLFVFIILLVRIVLMLLSSVAFMIHLASVASIL